jgi:hypothetical protein
MKVHGGSIDLHFFDLGGNWSASRPGRFTPGERAPGTNRIGGSVDPRPGLDDVEKRNFLTLPALELRPLSRPARSQSLYRLSYPGSLGLYVTFNKHDPVFLLKLNYGAEVMRT